MSIEIMENLVKFVKINTDRLENNLSTICKTEHQTIVRDYLPCSNLDANGENIIKCEDCPFSSVEAGKETIIELNRIIKKQKMKDLLTGKST